MRKRPTPAARVRREHAPGGDPARGDVRRRPGLRRGARLRHGRTEEAAAGAGRASSVPANAARASSISRPADSGRRPGASAIARPSTRSSPGGTCARRSRRPRRAARRPRGRSGSSASSPRGRTRPCARTAAPGDLLRCHVGEQHAVAAACGGDGVGEREAGQAQAARDGITIVAGERPRCRRSSACAWSSRSATGSNSATSSVRRQHGRSASVASSVITSGSSETTYRPRSARPASSTGTRLGCSSSASRSMSRSRRSP